MSSTVLLPGDWTWLTGDFQVLPFLLPKQKNTHLRPQIYTQPRPCDFLVEMISWWKWFPGGAAEFSRLRISSAQNCVFMCFFSIFTSLFTRVTSAMIMYDKRTLLDIGQRYTNLIQNTLYTDPAWPLEILRSTEADKGRLNNTRRRKKHCGKRAGIRNRLRKRAHSPPLPSILLANVQSLDNKMDDLRARISFQRDIRDCNILCLTETWLTPTVPDTAVTPSDNFSVLRMDRTAEAGKTKGGGVCFFINKKWCDPRNISILSRSCSPHLEHLSIICRPFYLPQEFTSSLVSAVYIPPQADTSVALSKLHDELSGYINKHPDAACIIAGDFNKANLKAFTSVLRSCADQLAGLFTSIFNESLATSVVPTPFKKSVIIPVPKNSKPSCLNDYRPVALTSTVMKVFERLLKKHICSSIPATLDPLQFAYRPNRSTDDAISQVLHSSLTHIDSKNGNYVRLLFIDYSSAFNTIVPTKLAVKLSDLGLNTSLCDWIQDFLTARPQVVKVGQFTSNSITLNVGAPQGCVLSPLLYSLYTHDCVSSHSSTSIIKFADDTVVLGLINNDDEAAYLDEVERLTSWCQDNCLSLNVSKTKELIVDFRKRQQRPYTPLMISGTPVERVSSFKYLGVNISEDLTWTTHIQTQVKKARQRLYHLRQLRKFRVSPAILKTFYSGAIESVLTQCISVWYGNSSNQDCKALQRVVRLAERISGSTLPSLQDIYLKRCKSRAAKIIKDSNHPGNHLFRLLPSGKRFRSMMVKTERLRRSFFPQAIRLLNTNSVS